MTSEYFKMFRKRNTWADARIELQADERMDPIP
jgi:hypothetical protein